MTQPTHFIEVWKGIFDLYTEKPKDIIGLSAALYGTEKAGCKTLFIWKITLKTK